MKKTQYRIVMVIAVVSICLLLAGCAAGTVSASATAIPEPSASEQYTPLPSEAPSFDASPLPAASEDESSDGYTDDSSDDYEDESAPTPPPLSDTKSLKTFKEDIDSDGSKETVSVAEQTVADPEGESYNIFVYVQDGADTKGTYVDCPADFNSAYITEMDNGNACLIVSLMFEDAYCNTFFFSFSASAAVPEVTLDGSVSEVKGTEIKIEDWGDALGSWNYYQMFKLGDDFSLTATTEMMIEPSGERTSLHTIKDLPVWMLVDGVYKKTFVKAGEDIIPVSTDCASYLKFKLKDGSSGRINYTSTNAYGNYFINGVNEYEYFDNIEYWG